MWNYTSEDIKNLNYLLWYKTTNIIKKLIHSDLFKLSYLNWNLWKEYLKFDRRTPFLIIYFNKIKSFQNKSSENIFVLSLIELFII